MKAPTVVCPTGRQAYADKATAVAALGQIIHKGSATTNIRRVKKCGVCGGYHLTSLRPPQDGRRRRARYQEWS